MFAEFATIARMLVTAERHADVEARVVEADIAGADAGRDAARHVTFGFGIHQCLGQTLARVELRIVFEAILRRLPGLRLAVPFEQVRFKDDMQIYGVHNLPVSW